MSYLSDLLADAMESTRVRLCQIRRIDFREFLHGL